MKDIAQELRGIVESATAKLMRVSPEEAALKPAENKWSKKEVLGHLIDSAGNNQQKFVRSMAGRKIEFVGYAQDHWIESQKYNKRGWEELIELWKAFNLHIAHIIEHAEPSDLKNEITIEGVGPFSLEFIMKDYLEHLKHHLLQILPDSEFESSFENVYDA